MARKAPGKDRMIVANAPQRDAHERMLDEMHSALYSLGSKIRKPYPSEGDKLLPKGLVPAENDEAKQAREHIAMMHSAMKGLSKGQEKK